MFKKILVGSIITFLSVVGVSADWTVDGQSELLVRTITACPVTPAEVGNLAPLTEWNIDTLCGAGWTINNGAVEDFQGLITTCTEDPFMVGLFQFATLEAHDTVCGANPTASKITVLVNTTAGGAITGASTIAGGTFGQIIMFFIGLVLLTSVVALVYGAIKRKG